MLNQIILVGRISREIEVEEGEKTKAVVTLAVPRSYKNADGMYDTDFIPCVLWSGIATNTKECCKKGDLIGVKGRIQSNEDGITVVAEKITFLSSKPKED